MRVLSVLFAGLAAAGVLSMEDASDGRRTITRLYTNKRLEVFQEEFKIKLPNKTGSVMELSPQTDFSIESSSGYKRSDFDVSPAFRVLSKSSSGRNVDRSTLPKWLSDYIEDSLSDHTKTEKEVSYHSHYPQTIMREQMLI